MIKLFQRNQRVLSKILFQQPKKVQKLNYNIPLYTFFGFGNKEKKESPQQQQFNTLNQQYKDFLEQQRFSIRNPYEQNHFISEEEKNKQLKQLEKDVKDYIDVDKFNKTLDEDALIAILSKVSYTVHNQPILDLVEFQKIIIEKSEQCYGFNSQDNFCQFLHFCSIQNIPNIEVVFESFSSHIQNNIKNFTFHQKLSILSAINDRSYVEISRFFDIFENPLLQNIQQESGSRADLSKIRQILDIYRRYDKGSENFYFTLESIIKENLKEIKIPILIELIQYYSGQHKERIESRIEMMQLLQDKVLDNIRFLTVKEIIQTYYCFIKFGHQADIMDRSSTDLFIQALDQRVVLLIDEMSIKEIDSILVIANNSKPQSRTAIFLACEQYIKTNISKIPRKHIPELFFQYSENNIGSSEFFEVMESKLIEFLHNLSPELLSKSAWSFAVNTETFKADLFFNKLEEILPKILPNSSIKIISNLVWSFSKVKFEQKQEIYDLFEDEIAKRQLSGKDAAQLLWAYTLNRPLKPETLQQIVESMFKNIEELDNWDISTIIWSFSQYEETQAFNFIFEYLHQQTIEIVDEMTYNEYLGTFRGYVETGNETQELYESIKERLVDEYLEYEYSQVMLSIYCITSIKNFDISSEKELVEKLKKRAEELLMLVEKQQEEMESGAKIDLQDEEYYLRQQKLEELRS